MFLFIIINELYFIECLNVGTETLMWLAFNQNSRQQWGKKTHYDYLFKIYFTYKKKKFNMIVFWVSTQMIS